MTYAAQPRSAGSSDLHKAPQVKSGPAYAKTPQKDRIPPKLNEDAKSNKNEKKRSQDGEKRLSVSVNQDRDGRAAVRGGEHPRYFLN